MKDSYFFDDELSWKFSFKNLLLSTEWSVKININQKVLVNIKIWKARYIFLKTLFWFKRTTIKIRNAVFQECELEALLMDKALPGKYQIANVISLRCCLPGYVGRHTIVINNSFDMLVNFLCWGAVSLKHPLWKYSALLKEVEIQQ